MTSTFGWLDNDDEQRRRMVEVVDLFREQGTIDELGIGSIRDTLSNAMFPGTSTLHTRLRYVLFLPWLLQRASAKSSPPQMLAEFRRLEYRLINGLMAGGENEGVMGNVAGTRLKRLPSAAYWSALRMWGLVDAASTDSFFRREVDYKSLVARTARPDDEEARDQLPRIGIDPELPRAPDGFVADSRFALTSDEGVYLSDRIALSTKGTLLAWLVSHQPANVGAEVGVGEAKFPWEIANATELDESLASMIDHARRFSLMVHGAALAYNLALAHASKREDKIAEHELGMSAWQSEEGASECAATWDRSDWWSMVSKRNPQLRPATRMFIDEWVTLVASGADLLSNPDAIRVVSNRERQIKGGRARLVNRKALDQWSGASGLGRLDFRWNISSSHLQDLYSARAVA